MTVVWSVLRSRLFAALTGMDKDSLEPHLDRKCERLVNGISYDMFVPTDIDQYYRFRSVFLYLIKTSLYLPATLSPAVLSCELLFRLSSCKRRLIKFYHENERKGSLWENTYFYACILFSYLFSFLRNTNVYSLWHRHLALLFWYHSGGPQDLGSALKREWDQFLY